MSHPLLSVNQLTIQYRHEKGYVSAVRDVHLSLEKGKTLGLVGESGSGKSTLALSILGLLPKEESRVTSGTIHFEDTNLLAGQLEDWAAIRGKKIAMVFQDPFSSLNPVLTIGYQINETLSAENQDAQHAKATSLLEQVQLPDPQRILDSYPHQLSGGQRQRVLIAMALAQDPDLLIADEPTTALDVTIQDEIIQLLNDLQKKRHMAMIFVTHNMGLIKNVADQLAVMYAGQIVEQGATTAVLKNPNHPYTKGLLSCIPKLETRGQAIPVLEGSPPEPHSLPSGCPFHPRCPAVFDPCAAADPDEKSISTRKVRCHLF